MIYLTKFKSTVLIVRITLICYFRGLRRFTVSRDFSRIV